MENALVSLQPRESETMPNGWSDLPPKLLTVILSRIFLSDRCNFKLVCKSWNSIIPISQPLPPPIESPEFSSPCFMFPNIETRSWKVFHSSYNQFYDLFFEEIKDAEIHYSKYGWLLMSRDDGLELFFFNPFTKEKIELPSIACRFYTVCFTAPPTSPDCTVVGMFWTVSTVIEFGILKLVGDVNVWESQMFGNKDDDFTRSICPPLYCNGVYYCLDRYTKEVYVFDPTEEQEERRWVPYKKEDEKKKTKKPISGDIAEDYMLEVEGEIWGVFVTRKGRLNVTKLDLLGMRWIKFETLGDKCLYISPRGSFAETSTVNGTKNKIYFNRFHRKRGCFVSGVLYSLKSRMYHSIEGDFAKKDAYGLIKLDYGAWIKPTV